MAYPELKYCSEIVKLCIRPAVCLFVINPESWTEPGLGLRLCNLHSVSTTILYLHHDLLTTSLYLHLLYLYLYLYLYLTETQTQTRGHWNFEELASGESTPTLGHGVGKCDNYAGSDVSSSLSSLHHSVGRSPR